MTVAGGTTTSYHVQTTAAELRDGFPWFGYHASVSALWDQKWRPVCSHGVYPFTDAAVEDFDPVFAELVRLSGDDPGILSRPEEYAAPFLPVARALVERAERTQDGGDSAQARDLFLRAAAVFRIARFPINRSPLTQTAWEEGQAAYARGGELLDPPSYGMEIPFAADTGAGDLDAPVRAYLRVPTGTPPQDGWPVLLFICGLDAYRTDHTNRTQEHVEHGFATLSFEIPGTGDCPAAPGDPTSSERLMTSVLDWVASSASTYGFDTTKVVARGVSTGGYHAFRLAHTHADRLLAVVAQGGAAHHMFDPGWIGAQNQMEYPFALADALAYKFGYRDGDLEAARAAYAADGHRFSLVEGGVLGTPSCRLLAINGMEDSIFPIEDSLMVATDGHRKDLVVRADRGHMGNPGAEPIVYSWIDDVVAGRA